MKTLAELIIFVFMGVLILLVVLNISGFLSPQAASVGCGLNLRVTAATLSHTKIGNAGVSLVGAPVLMCNQYQNPVDINAANFNACSGISDFCKKAKSDALVECWKQCARIQVDKLTNICWTMAGSGNLDFKDTVFQAFSNDVEAIKDVSSIANQAIPDFFVKGPMGAAMTTTNNVVKLAIKIATHAKVVRCFRFRIVNPIIADKKPIVYEDYSLGRSWGYAPNYPYTQIPMNYFPNLAQANVSSSFGGVGVSYVNDLSTGTSYVVNGANVTLPETGTNEATLGWYLNYQITDPRNQICYIAYYQTGTGRKFTVRSCKYWSEYASSAYYLN